MLGERLDDAASGIVDENVEPAKTFAGEIDGPFRGVLPGEIAAMVCDLGPELLLQMRGCILQPALVEVGQHELCAVPGQSLSNCEADALCGAGDDRNVVFKFLVH